ncbi:unnamed protein product, partial [Symbiodinium microadriaticum]
MGGLRWFFEPLRWESPLSVTPRALSGLNTQTFRQVGVRRPRGVKPYLDLQRRRIWRFLGAPRTVGGEDIKDIAVQDDTSHMELNAGDFTLIASCAIGRVDRRRHEKIAPKKRTIFAEGHRNKQPAKATLDMFMVNKAGFEHTLEPETPRNDAADPTGLNTDGPQAAGEKREGRPIDAAASKRAKKEETGAWRLSPTRERAIAYLMPSPTHFGCDTRATSKEGAWGSALEVTAIANTCDVPVRVVLRRPPTSSMALRYHQRHYEALKGETADDTAKARSSMGRGLGCKPEETRTFVLLARWLQCDWPLAEVQRGSGLSVRNHLVSLSLSRNGAGETARKKQ